MSDLMKGFCFEKRDEKFLPAPDPDPNLERKYPVNGDTFSKEFVLQHRPRNKWRYNVYRLVEIDGVEHYVLSHRVVDMRSVLEYTRLTTPRYLFRVFSGNYSQLNGPEGFKSFAMVGGFGAQDMSAYSEADMAENLKGHVEKRRDAKSHFISFKGSWMWAIRRALRLREKLRFQKERAEKKQRAAANLNARDEEALEDGFTNVHMAIIDTCKLSRPTLLINAYAMLRAHNLEREYLKDKSHGEILVWDEIKGPFHIISLQTFLKHQPGEQWGNPLLLKLQPFLLRDARHHNMVTRKQTKQGPIAMTIYRKPFEIRRIFFLVHEQRQEAKNALDMVGREKTHRWEHRATAMHQGVGNSRWYGKDERFPISPEILMEYVSFVESRFPDEFRFPMTVTLLSGRLRHLDRQSIVEKIVAVLRGTQIVKTYKLHKASKLHHSLEELDVFDDLLQECCEALNIKACHAEDRPCLQFASTTYGHYSLPNISQMTRLDVPAMPRATKRKRGADDDSGYESPDDVSDAQSEWDDSESESDLDLDMGIRFDGEETESTGIVGAS